MHPKTIYRIYTEEKNKRAIVRLAGEQFESFTLQPTLGYYQGKPEKSIVIEIVGASQRAVEQLARRIRKMNGQKSVLLIRVPGEGKVTRGRPSRK
jgi:hypothetical protein